MSRTTQMLITDTLATFMVALAGGDPDQVMATAERALAAAGWTERVLAPVSDDEVVAAVSMAWMTWDQRAGSLEGSDAEMRWGSVLVACETLLEQLLEDRLTAFAKSEVVG